MFLKKHDRILFQGDSISHAFRRPEETGTSYRLGAGWVMMLAARLQAEHPGLGLQIDNRGECGNAIGDLWRRWDSDCLNLKPTVLNLLVGVNDTARCCSNGGKGTATEFRETYRRLLSRTREALPEVRLVMCEPFLLETGAVTADWIATIRDLQEIVRALASEFGAIHVPLQRRFNDAAAATGAAYWLFDGIHPNAPGQWLIMQAWLDATGLS